MVFEQATMEDIDEVSALYDAVTEHLASHVNYPGWRKGIYPNRETAETAARNGQLFVCRDNGRIVGSVVLKQEPEPQYNRVKWIAEDDYSRIYVIHTFMSHPECRNRGVAAFMLDAVTEKAKAENKQSIRLDACYRNIPAIHVYERAGFRYVDTISLDLEDIGLPWFNIYEKVL